MVTILFLLTAYGITNIMVFSYIFEPIRDFLIKYNPKFLGELITCPMCLSVWVGISLTLLFNITGNINLTPYGCYNIENLYVVLFMNSMTTSGSVWILHTVQEYFEKE